MYLIHNIDCIHQLLLTYLSLIKKIRRAANNKQELKKKDYPYSVLCPPSMKDSHNFTYLWLSPYT